MDENVKKSIGEDVDMMGEIATQLLERAIKISRAYKKRNILLDPVLVFDALVRLFIAAPVKDKSGEKSSG